MRFLYTIFTLRTRKTPFAQGGRGGGLKSVSRGDCEQQGGKLLRLMSQLRPRIWPLYDSPILFGAHGEST